jgi:gas vesicle structural protein
MTVAAQGVNRAPRPSSLADVLNVVLDKGIVIDAYVRIAVVGIELLTIDARIVIASVDTYLRFAEAVNRLELQPNEQVAGLPGLIEQITGDGAKDKPRNSLEGARDQGSNARSAPTDDRDEDEDDSGRQETRRAPAQRSSPRSRKPSR